jgi:prophage DNA circulation protein
MAIPQWRLRLQPASYNGVQFHVDGSTRASGRRIALHEFPKRDTPYAEDMGRKAKRFSVVAYVIGPNYEDQRDALIAQLEAEGAGLLVLPTSTDQKKVVIDNYSVTERREQGGYATIEMTFIEAGQDPYDQVQADTQSQVTNSADTSISALTQQAQSNISSGAAGL